MQRSFEKTKYAADILFHLKELYVEKSRHERFTAVKELMTSRMRDGTSVREHGIRQSGPRPDSRLLRQTALEVLTRSARSDSPRQTGRKEIPATIGGGRRRRTAGGGGGAWRGEVGGGD
ncbi:hypothetical protein F511_46938 [Dorcoceras hygrometricum]|uniref:Uncharacterized protein n=1 Tax=Dorcoceras hygrometricum TaxID=472368 RepID=A0A2Z6ZSB7_9LAMI|nr:hypothetical protein F511_46938 [Dorcoceras hygrometricum]